MTPARYLIDTSALARLVTSKPGTYAWEAMIEAGHVGICPLTELEFLYSARSRAHRRTMADHLRTLFCYTPIDDGSYTRALEVQELLTDRGMHRGTGPVDLLLAATAELQQLTVLHHDNDFDAIASVTGQSVQRLTAVG